mgnify:CR=1 FL=1
MEPFEKRTRRCNSCNTSQLIELTCQNRQLLWTDRTDLSDSSETERYHESDASEAGENCTTKCVFRRLNICGLIGFIHALRYIRVIF